MPFQTLKFITSLVPVGIALGMGASCGDNLSAELTVSGFVFEDRNSNGIFDEGEGTAGWSVFLESADGTGERFETRTDAQGEYRFEGVAPGDYFVSQEMQFGWASAPQGNPRLVSAEQIETPNRTPVTQKEVGASHIIGGSESAEAAYPFMASIGYFDGQFYHFCGGALVSDRYVVTAAHCSEGVDAIEVAVSLGTNNPDVSGHVALVSEIIVHPLWDGETSDGHDISLWKLSEPLDLEQLGLSTVSMLDAESRTLASDGALASTLGWGVSDTPGDRLREVHLPIVSDQLCSENYPGISTFETQICAGLPEGGLDSCQGDSGGPLLVRDQEGKRWMHAGITSWGRGCGLEGFPGIYGRTSALSSWAQEQMQEVSQRTYRVSLTRFDIEADFGNRQTTRELIGDIDVRWGMAALTPNGLSNNQIAEDTPFTVGFRLVEDGDSRVSGFVCTLDRDGSGPEEPTTFSCEAGINEVAVAGYPVGSYLPQIKVSAGGRTKSRELELVVLATPEN